MEFCTLIRKHEKRQARLFFPSKSVVRTGSLICTDSCETVQKKSMYPRLRIEFCDVNVIRDVIIISKAESRGAVVTCKVQ